MRGRCLHAVGILKRLHTLGLDRSMRDSKPAGGVAFLPEVGQFLSKSFLQSLDWQVQEYNYLLERQREELLGGLVRATWADKPI